MLEQNLCEDIIFFLEIIKFIYYINVSNVDVPTHGILMSRMSGLVMLFVLKVGVFFQTNFEIYLTVQIRKYYKRQVGVYANDTHGGCDIILRQQNLITIVLCLHITYPNTTGGPTIIDLTMKTIFHF